MILSIIFFIILYFIWFAVVTTPMLMFFMPFAMASGEPNLGVIKQCFFSIFPLAVAAVVYIVLPCAAFYMMVGDHL